MAALAADRTQLAAVGKDRPFPARTLPFCIVYEEAILRWFATIETKVCFEVAAPRAAFERFAMKANVCAAIFMAGITIAASTELRAPAADGYVQFEDPLEHAFNLDVPIGWTVRGGMFRFGYSDFRPMLDLKSADGNSSIRSGDVAVPRAYALPTAVHPNDGDLDDLGAQAQLVYAKYRSGKAYAKLYALARFKTLCRTLTPQPADWTPPQSTGEAGAQSSAGSVTYRCAGAAARTRTAYVFATTQRLAAAANLWQVSSLVSYIAPADRVASIRAILVRGSHTFMLDPVWIAHQKKNENVALRYQRLRQQGRLVDLQRQEATFAARMRGMQAQVNSFERGQAARAGNFQGFDNALHGVTPTVDPLNGQTRDVWTGPNHAYWENGSGTIVNANSSPGSGFRELRPE